MTKFLFTGALALAAVTAAMPASAQPVGDWGGRGPGRGAGIERQLDRIAFRIERGERNGALTRGESRRLRGQLNDIAQLERRYSFNGLDRREWQDLNRRISVLENRVWRQKRDDDVRRW